MYSTRVCVAGVIQVKAAVTVLACIVSCRFCLSLERCRKLSIDELVDVEIHLRTVSGANAGFPRRCSQSHVPTRAAKWSAAMFVYVRPVEGSRLASHFTEERSQQNDNYRCAKVQTTIVARRQPKIKSWLHCTATCGQRAFAARQLPCKYSDLPVVESRMVDRRPCRQHVRCSPKDVTKTSSRGFCKR